MSNDKVNTYGAEQIQVLEGLEAVRKRPGMYIGSTDNRGFHHLWVEIFDNAVDEVSNGYGETVIVRLNKDGSVTVRDFGRGVPVDIHKTGKPAIEVIFTTLHAGGKFGSGGYKTAGGLHGVGSSVVNALSEYMNVYVYRDSKKYQIKFGDGGKVAIPLTVVEDNLMDGITGTEVTFLPMERFFHNCEFSIEVIKEKMRETACLLKGKTFVLIDDRHKEVETEIYQTGIDSDIIMGYYEEQLLKEDVETDNEYEKESLSEEPTILGIENIVAIYRFDDGIKEYLEEISLGNRGITSIIEVYGENEESKIEMDVVFKWTNDFHEKVVSFANNVKTKDGGTHETGLKSAITRAVNDYAKLENTLVEKFKKNKKLFGKDGKLVKGRGKKFELKSLDGELIRQGLVAIISVRIPEDLLEFEGQTKGKLGTSLAKSNVENLVYQAFYRYLTENPKEGNKIIENTLKNYEMKLQTDSMKRKAKKGSVSIANRDKVTEATGKDPKKKELFLCEGSSAGGSAKQGRDRKYQGILELKGKTLNTEKASEHVMLDNAECVTILDTIGAGYGENFDFEKARYHKVILLTDADNDGMHIQILLMSFFYRYMRPLIEEGMLYIANPPLYAVKQLDNRGNVKKIKYCWSDGVDESSGETELNKAMKSMKNGVIQRYKGLGEMNAEQLWETTMNPQTRTLTRVEMGDVLEVERSLKLFLGDSAENERKAFIEKKVIF